jgi:hypothetical protein
VDIGELPQPPQPPQPPIYVRSASRAKQAPANRRRLAADGTEWLRLGAHRQ